MLSKIPVIPLLKSIAPRLQYTPAIVRGLWRKHYDIKKDLSLDDGVALKPPYQISLRITNKCNQKCAICGQYGTNGYMNTSKGRELLNDIPVWRYKKLVDEVAKYKPVFYITGGEALLYDGLFELTDYIKKKGCYVYVITNGSLLGKHAHEIVKQKWDMLASSFDGPEEIHDQCRGIRGTFQQTVKGIRELKLERKRQSVNTPYFMLSSTISSTNQHKLEELFETAASIGPECLLLYLSWFTTEDIGKRHQKILKEELGVDAVTWKSYIGQNVNIDTEKLKETLAKISKKKYPFMWFPIPNISLNKLDTYYNEPQDFMGYSNCIAPYLMIDIMPNGDVVTCRDYIDVKVGNIMEDKLLDIWNNQKFKDFRKVLKKHGGVLPQCSRCCGLMGF